MNPYEINDIKKSAKLEILNDLLVSLEKDYQGSTHADAGYCTGVWHSANVVRHFIKLVVSGK